MVPRSQDSAKLLVKLEQGGTDRVNFNAGDKTIDRFTTFVIFS
jgi:hypothetical protein